MAWNRSVRPSVRPTVRPSNRPSVPGVLLRGYHRLIYNAAQQCPTNKVSYTGDKIVFINVRDKSTRYIQAKNVEETRSRGIEGANAELRGQLREGNRVKSARESEVESEVRAAWFKIRREHDNDKRVQRQGKVGNEGDEKSI